MIMHFLRKRANEINENSPSDSPFMPFRAVTRSRKLYAIKVEKRLSVDRVTGVKDCKLRTSTLSGHNNALWNIIDGTFTIERYIFIYSRERNEQREREFEKCNSLRRFEKSVGSTNELS